MWFLRIVRSCGLQELWSQMLRRPQVDCTIHELKIRKVTAKRPGVNVRLPHGCCSYHNFAVWPPYGRCKGALRPPQRVPWGRPAIFCDVLYFAFSVAGLQYCLQVFLTGDLWVSFVGISKGLTMLGRNCTVWTRCIVLSSRVTTVGN